MPGMAEIALFLSLVILGVAAWLVVRVQRSLEEKHRAMLADLHEGLTRQADRLDAKLDQRLEQISRRVSERLDDGFRKTNETFVSVMQRLATIDGDLHQAEIGAVAMLGNELGVEAEDRRGRRALAEFEQLPIGGDMVKLHSRRPWLAENNRSPTR